MAIITITGTYKSGQKLLAELLSKKLGYKAIDKEIIENCSRKYNILQKDLLDELEKVPGLWKRLSGKQHRQLIYIKCALFDEIKNDNIIYYGPFGQLFLSGLENVIKIFVDRPFEERVNDVIKEMKTSKEKAIKYLEDIDQNREKVVKMLYDVDWQNLSLYDISIYLEKISLETLSDMIVTLLEKGNFKTTEKQKNLIKLYSLENEIKAAIAADDELWDQDIIVKVKENKIIVTGAIKNKKLKEELMNTVNQVKGIGKVDYYIDILTEPIKVKPFMNS